LVEISVRVPAGPDRVGVLGAAERNLKMLREALGVTVVARDDLVQVRGEPEAVAVARRVLERLGQSAHSRGTMSRQEVLDLITSEVADAPGRGADDELASSRDPRAMAFDDGPWGGRLAVYAGGRQIRARSVNQDRYLESIRTRDLVFGIGPAGTGKTYLAVAAAVHLLKAGRINKVILVRPAVEAGERLGFLPGDLQAKVNPYLRPLFDALHDMMDFATIRRFMENDVVEVVPLAYMRGRTLNKAVIILDEAQNTTKGQMKMFLTRMGQGSKMVITGDATQIDLPDPRESGLIDAARRLARTDGVAFIGFGVGDVVRHPMVQKVIDAYGEDDAHTRSGLEAIAEVEAQAAAERTRRRPRPADAPEETPD
jgi:phosphate starvation-inducible PhoH-like protein